MDVLFGEVDHNTQLAPSVAVISTDPNLQINIFSDRAIYHPDNNNLGRYSEISSAAVQIYSPDSNRIPHVRRIVVDIHGSIGDEDIRISVGNVASDVLERNENEHQRGIICRKICVIL